MSPSTGTSLRILPAGAAPITAPISSLLATYPGWYNSETNPVAKPI